MRVASPSASEGDLEITVTESDSPKLMEWPILPEEVQIPNCFFRGFISKAMLFPKTSLFEYIPHKTLVSFTSAISPPFSTIE